MSINHAILGMLSYKSLTGYDLKKIMQDSPFMYWSGNNNQIYKVLLELNNDGFVTSETQHQDGSPSKKVYTITEDGLGELKKWSLSMPEAPEIKKAFLVQLAWTWQLSNGDMKMLIDRYEQEVKGRLFIEQSHKNKGRFSPNRTPRETAIWELIYENTTELYQQELNWIKQLRQTIDMFDTADYADHESIVQAYDVEEKPMEYTIIEKNAKKYVYLGSEGKQIQTVQDALTLVETCIGNDTDLLLMQGERLSDDFFRLRTGVAGAVLQKLSMIKVAVILSEERAKGKFKDFIIESNRGNRFHTYSNKMDAEKWLLQTNERVFER